MVTIAFYPLLACRRTNITEPSASYRSSRGRLVSSFLLAPGAHSLTDHVAELVQQEKDTAYAGFNLLLLEASRSQRRGPSGLQLEFDAMLVTNGGGGGALSARGLTPAERACGGLSNGIDGRGADAWPKVVRGTAALEGVLSEITSDTTLDDLAERLFALLTCVPSPVPFPPSLPSRFSLPPCPLPFLLLCIFAVTPLPPCLLSPCLLVPAHVASRSASTLYCLPFRSLSLFRAMPLPLPFQTFFPPILCCASAPACRPFPEPCGAWHNGTSARLRPPTPILRLPVPFSRSCPCRRPRLPLD